MSEKTSPIDQVVEDESPDFKSPGLSVDDRVRDLLSRMTIEEKVGQMMCIWGQKKTLLFNEKHEFDLTHLRQQFPHGIGQIARLSDTGKGLTAKETAELANTLQRFFLEETRLGIPVIFHEECLHGLAAKESTSYPQPIGLASTFNPGLVQAIYSAIAATARSRGTHQALTPVVDVARDPRWGRVEETFGEDPHLVAAMGNAAVNGFQGDRTYTDKKHVLATLKHFAAHGQPESGMNCGPVNVSERVLRDVFLHPFLEVIRDAKAASVMASYNEIDGVPSHANAWLLKDVLRTEWGFDGTVVSDYYAITELNKRDEATSHALASDKAEAAALAVNAGVNLETPDPDCYPFLVRLVHEGVVSESAIDELVGPLLRQKFQLGLFEDPYVDAESIHIDVELERERELALRAARETIVLLKNKNNALPLARSKKTIAVIGPNADRELLGGYSGKPKYYTSVLRGIREKVGSDVNVLYSEGCRITIGGSWNEDPVHLPDHNEDKKLIEQAVATARQAETVILVLGGNEQTSREAWSRVHMGDRPSLDLLGMQNELAQQIIALGKPVIVLLFNGRPKSITYLDEHADAILECWYLGQETGHAVADVLFGEYNPSGKLPMTFPRSVGHVPAYYNYKPSARRGYLFDDVTPLYPFGFGLSYTTFSLSDLNIKQPVIRKGEPAVVSVRVQNTGKCYGEEVVQLYVRDLVGSVTRPVKELRGFRKIALNPGESATATFEIRPEHLAFTNIEKQFVVEPGEFEIMVGSSSRDRDLMKTNLQVI
ncbi:MAG: glycoside hydrolase family 3 C-terminal domain-containing protein [Ignavibacteriae bacterium]|nr:glycoside hydrolase family 3 C-terminal domain-containing protein [Ignavibacteriota bacterium]